MQKTQSLFDQPQETEQVYSVSEYLDHVNSYLKKIDVVIEGEITSISNRRHIYFSISDSSKTNTATCSCALWEFKARRLAFELEVGMMVRITGSANIYKPNGRFTFIVENIAPVGEGALQKAFEALKKSLESKGYFDQSRKRLIPKYPEKVAVVTSQNGDAIKDFKTHVMPVGLQIFHVDSRVEGLSAVSDIVAAISYINRVHPHLDVIVLTRGGGSLESLQAFNSLEVAQAIFASRIPIISAVGHENDITIADLVADKRASTPTDAGNVISQDWRQEKIEVTVLSNSLFAHMQHRLQSLRNDMDSAWVFWCQIISDHLNSSHHFMYRLVTHLTRQIQMSLEKYKESEIRFQYAFAQTKQKIDQALQLCAYSQASIVRTFKTVLQYNQQVLKSSEKQLRVSDPTLKLKQGYSITWNDQGKVVKNIDQVSVGEKITTQLHGGKMKATVINT